MASFLRNAVVFFAFTACMVAQQRRITAPVNRLQVRPLRGTLHPRAPASLDAGPVDAGLPMERVTLVLPPSAAQQADLDGLLRAQQTNGSSDFHRWLTPEQFADRFGANPADIATISQWLQGEGLAVGGVARARNSIWFSGTAAQIQAALHTSLRRYIVNGENHFANDTEPSLPAAIAPLVGGIRGLHDFHLKSNSVSVRPLHNSASGKHSLAPDDLATIYNISPLYSRGFSGNGQRIVVPGQSAIKLTDIAAFRSTYGLPPNVPQVVLVPGSADPGIINDDEVEADLDVEWSGAVARQATIIYVYSGDAFESTFYAIDQNLAPTISLSFGGCEVGLTPLDIRSVQGFAQQANAQGITWLASSGDAGSTDCDKFGDPTTQQATLGLAVDFPASLPEVTAVGGTQLNEGTGTYWAATNNTTSASALSYIPEVAWNETGATNGLLGGGGGFSKLFAQPWWQSGPTVPAGTARMVPDVALVSAVAEGYRVVSEGLTYLVGGTSASSPSFAGILALVNQYQIANGLQTQLGQGNINPNLYAIAQTTPAAFHDITGGDNIVPCVAASPDCPALGKIGYSAGPGYDTVTGLGSIDGYLFAGALTTQWSVPAISSLSPTGAFAGSGSFTLFVYGSGFDPGTVVQWMGAALPTTVLSPTEVMATVGTAQLARAGSASVSVLTSRGPSAAASFAIKPSLGALITAPILTKTPPSPTGCAIPPVATSFSTANTVYLYFQAIISPNDAFSLDWIAPNGTVVDLAQFSGRPITGFFCFPGSSLDLSTTGITDPTGTWYVRVYDQGSLLFTIPFTVRLAIKDPFPGSGQVVPASGGLQSVNLTFPAGYTWNVSSSANWTSFPAIIAGTGSTGLSFLVAPNTGASRTATFTIGDYSFTVEQQAASITGLNFVGSVPHIAAEENWTTTFTLVNKSGGAVQSRLNLFGDPAGTLTLPLTFPQQTQSLPLLAASLDRTVAPNASLVINSAGPQTPRVLVGSAQLSANGALDGFAIFNLIPGAQEAVVPLETRNAGSYLLAFDNTGGVALGVAIENVSAQTASVAVVIRDDTGKPIGSGTISLPASGHSSFVVSSQFPVTAGQRGTLEFDTPSGGRISVLGIRTTPLGNSTTLTTIPALANVGTTGGSIAHLASGNGWQTTFVLINTGTSAAQAQLNFYADGTGSPLPLPISFPQTGSTVTPVSSVTQPLAPGATLLIQSTGALADPLLTGSAQLTTNGNVSGFVIFRYIPNGQEAVVPLESRNASAYILAFDNTNGTATGIAVNNASAQQASIPVTVRDDAGNQLATDTLTVAPNGHVAFTLGSDKYQAATTLRGTIEFDTPPGGQIGALGIRIPVTHTFTTLPALAK